MTLSEAFDDLEQHLIGDEDQLPEVLSDLAEVERTLRAIAWRRRKIGQAEQVAQAVIDQANAHVEAERHRYDPTFLVDRLRGYHQARLADDPKAKSLRFPAGELVARKLPDQWVFDDDFLVWAVQHGPDLVRTKREVDRPAAKKALRVVDGRVLDPLSGEVVPAVTVTPGEVSFAVKTDGES